MPETGPEQFSFTDTRTQTQSDRLYAQNMEDYFARSTGNSLDKLRNFTKYVPRQNLTTFLAKHEIFKNILTVHGHIIECGVYLGGGLMTWGQLSAIYEPHNHVRRIVGFDTFSGFPRIDEKDKGDNLEYAQPGGLATNALEDIQQCVGLYDLNRPIGHIPRIECVAGDATQTIPKYIEENQHLVVSMLYLDFDIYEPTKTALEYFLPRMPKGAVIAFDELDQKQWPGETLAAMEVLGLRNLRIQRFPFATQLSFAILD